MMHSDLMLPNKIMGGLSSKKHTLVIWTELLGTSLNKSDILFQKLLQCVNANSE